MKQNQRKPGSPNQRWQLGNPTKPEATQPHVIDHKLDLVREGSQELKLNRYQAGKPRRELDLQRCPHVPDVSNRCQEDCQLYFVAPALIHRVHRHVSGGAHRVADIENLQKKISYI